MKITGLGAYWCDCIKGIRWGCDGDKEWPNIKGTTNGKILVHVWCDKSDLPIRSQNAA